MPEKRLYKNKLPVYILITSRFFDEDYRIGNGRLKRNFSEKKNNYLINFHNTN